MASVVECYVWMWTAQMAWRTNLPLCQSSILCLNETAWLVITNVCSPLQLPGWYVGLGCVRCASVSPNSPCCVLLFVHVGLSPEPNAQQAFPVKTHRRMHRYFLCLISQTLFLPLSSQYHSWKESQRNTETEREREKSSNKLPVKKRLN